MKRRRTSAITPAPRSLVSVHRFRDKVAVSVGDGSTTYLTVAQARNLELAIAACAKSIRAESFQDSNFATVSIPQESE